MREDSGAAVQQAHLVESLGEVLSRVLLIEDQLTPCVGAQPAELDGPAGGGIPGIPQSQVPREVLGEARLGIGRIESHRGRVRLEPAAQLVSKALLLRREVKIHRYSLPAGS